MAILRVIRFCVRLGIRLMPAAMLLAVPIGLFILARRADASLGPWDGTVAQRTSQAKLQGPRPDWLAGAGVAAGAVVLLGAICWPGRRLAIAALASAVLFEVVAFTWFRSYYGEESIIFDRTTEAQDAVYTDQYWCQWYRGRIEIRGSFLRRPGRPQSARDELRLPPRRIRWLRQAFSQLVREVPGSSPPTPSPTPPWLRSLGFVLWAAPPTNARYVRQLGWSLVIPHAAPAIVLALLPALWLTRFVRRSKFARRRRAGACVNCGYDLRASSGRCPECGAPAPVRDVSGVAGPALPDPPGWWARRSPRFRRRVRRWGLTAAVLIPPMVIFVPRAVQHVELLRLQSRCLTADLDLAAAPPTATTAPTTRPAPPPPPDPRWVALAQRLGDPDSPSPPARATLFLHERTSPAGHARLVVVEGDELLATVIEPAAPLRDARLIRGQSRACDDATRAATRAAAALVKGQVEFRPGRADLADPARFTLDVEIDGHAELLEGRLLDDDTVAITLPHADGLPARVLAAADNRRRDVLVIEAAARRPAAIAEAIARLRAADPAARVRAASDLDRLAADRPGVLRALFKAVRTGDMSAREGLAIALERALAAGVHVDEILAAADREPNAGSRACLNAARRAVAAQGP